MSRKVSDSHSPLHPPLAGKRKRLQHGAGVIRADTKQYHVGYYSRHPVSAFVCAAKGSPFRFMVMFNI